VPPKFLDPIFKIQPTADHSTKFRADRLTELGNTMAKLQQNKS